MFEDSETYRERRRAWPLRVQSDRGIRCRRRDHAPLRIRTVPRRPDRGSRHPVVRRPAGRHRRRDLLRRPWQEQQPRHRRRGDRGASITSSDAACCCATARASAAYDKFYQNIYPGGAVSADGSTVSLAGLQQRHRAAEHLQPDRLQHHRARAARSSTRCWPARSSGGRQPTISARPGYFTSIGPNATSYTVPVDAPTVSRAGRFPAGRHRRRQPRHRDDGRGVRAGSDRAVAPPPGRGRPSLRPIRRRLSQQPDQRRTSRAPTTCSRPARA